MILLMISLIARKISVVLSLLSHDKKGEKKTQGKGTSETHVAKIGKMQKKSINYTEIWAKRVKRQRKRELKSWKLILSIWKPILSRTETNCGSQGVCIIAIFYRQSNLL